jgi:hypothetical protein
MGGITAKDLEAIWQTYFEYPNQTAAGTPESVTQAMESISGKNYYTDLLTAVEQNVSGLTSNVQPQLGASWTGTAAELASGQITATANSLIHTGTQLTQVRDTLTNFWQKLQTYANELATTWNSAGNLSSYFNLETDGTLSYNSEPNLGATISPTPMGAAMDFFESFRNLGVADVQFSLNNTGLVPSKYLADIANALSAASAAYNINDGTRLAGRLTPAQSRVLQQEIQRLADAIEAWRQEASSQFQHLVSLANQHDSETAAELSKLMPASQVQFYQDMIQWGQMNSQPPAPATSSPAGTTALGPGTI